MFLNGEYTVCCQGVGWNETLHSSSFSSEGNHASKPHPLSWFGQCTTTVKKTLRQCFLKILNNAPWWPNLYFSSTAARTSSPLAEWVLCLHRFCFHVGGRMGCILGQAGMLPSPKPTETPAFVSLVLSQLIYLVQVWEDPFAIEGLMEGWWTNGLVPLHAMVGVWIGYELCN